MKVFRIVMTGEEHPHYTITNAFNAEFDHVDTIYWDEIKDIHQLNEIVKNRVDQHLYDAVFMQIQGQGIILPSTAKHLSERVPVVFNWTGDVRSDISWYVEMASSVVTLFTNETDVATMRSMGHRSDYLQTGYDHIHYHNDMQKAYSAVKGSDTPEWVGRMVEAGERANSIAFCGNYYQEMRFPLTTERVKAVMALKQVFPNQFNLYGRRWDLLGIKSEGFASNEWESMIYNLTSLALSVSHFDYSRYYSDRLLREMACGCCVLSHRFKDSHLEFEDGKEIVYFDDVTDLLDKTKYYLERPREARRIGDEAAKKVEQMHRWGSVVKRLRKLIQKHGYERTNSNAVPESPVQR